MFSRERAATVVRGTVGVGVYVAKPQAVFLCSALGL